MGILDRTPGTGVSCTAGNTLPGCDVCQLSKSKQRDHPKHRTTKPTTRKLELVYTDLQGPQQPSLLNYSYIAMFMDDLTKVKKPYFLQAKSGALDSLYNFVRDIAIPEGLHVGRLRSDNSGEYTGKAINDEYNSLMEQNTWDLVLLPPGRKLVGSHWLFRIKTNGRYKACFVAQGFSQIPGVDYFATFAPVARMNSVRLLLALVAEYNLDLVHLDVKTAFLQSELKEEIYVRQPRGFEKHSP
ncbi:unnamed protein product [Discosporangium mesarthrocarpum]